MTPLLAATLALLLVSIAVNAWTLRSMARNRRTMAEARRRLAQLQLATMAELSRRPLPPPPLAGRREGKSGIEFPARLLGPRFTFSWLRDDGPEREGDR
jgi:hypothetical protein